MATFNKEHFFFFYENCSNLDIFPNSIEHAYLNILNDDLYKAREIFSKIDSPRARWGVILTSILSEGWLEKFPSYFQIRNFLEIDVDFLIKNEKIEYIEQLLGALEFFVKVNSQAYKYIARVMLENHILATAFKYLELSKQIHYNDPELHYMYTKYYLERKDFKDAYNSINECLRLLPDYYPALLIKEKIEQIVN